MTIEEAVKSLWKIDEADDLVGPVEV